ncbi:MAG: sugar ABC transporter ATP-binding protein, partial [Eubacteriales bacterium]|nr:sugar ABC transporter ATP-binding protein [Eubacteriales bacterium]
LFLTHLEKKKNGFLDARGMQKQAQALFDRMNLELNPCTMVSELDASYKQIVEICKALLQNASLIIMDEPTTSLTEPEIERVFSIMRTLKEQGVGIIFISHKLNEVMEICDAYTVLRDGSMVASGQVSETDAHKLAAHMVGHEVRTEALRRNGELGAERLCIRHLSDAKHFHDISFTLKAGEVLGVTGLLGDGRSELFQTIFGAMGRHYSGEIVLDGKPIHPCQTYQALEYGIAYLPRNRKENAILKDMNVLDNGSLAELPRLHKGGFIDFSKQNSLFDEQVKNLRIKMGSKLDSITSLSGGNQQKVVLAKWLMTGPKVLLLDNPTQGVDVGAKEEIYDIIHKLASSGVAIVVISSEAQEIIRICDRALVLFHGALEGEVSGEEMNEHNIMFLATGGKAEKGGKKENGK